jgi:hypothetical protein
MSSPGATQIDSANPTSKSRLKSVLDLSYVRTFFFVIKVIMIVSICLDFFLILNKDEAI